MTDSDLNFIVSHDFRDKINKHKLYQLDLGNAYSQRASNGMVMNIKDIFVKWFADKTNVFCYKVGKLGPISFYTSPILPDHEVWIFKGEEKFIFKYNPLELEINMEKYLGKLIMEVNKIEE